MTVSRADLKRFLDGHRTAERVLRAETLRRLASLTEEEARTEYDSLCHVWEASRSGGNTQAMDRQAIDQRVALRRRLAGLR